MPPGDSGPLGFSEWAATVPEKPMPVRYSLTDNYVLLENIEGKQFTYEDYKIASERYVEHSVAITAIWARKEVRFDC